MPDSQPTDSKLNEDAMRDFTRALFRNQEADEPEPEPPDPKAGNVVSTAGRATGTPHDPEDDVREFVRALFAPRPRSTTNPPKGTTS